jgi:hypothetical protein
MSNEPKMTARERLMKRLETPIPPARRDPAKEREQIVQRNCEVLNLHPLTHEGQRRRWNVEVDKTTSYVGMKRTALEERIMMEVGEAARRRREWALNNPMGMDRWETIDNVVRRQDETR